MPEFTAAVHAELRDALSERLTEFAWTTEEYVRRTPVDVAGERDDLRVFVEVEMRSRKNAERSPMQSIFD